MANEQQLREALKNLLTAIQETSAADEAQAEQQNARIRLAVLRAESLVSSWDAQQPATPVGYMNEGHIHELAMRRIPYGYVYPEAGAGASTAVYTRPAPSVPADVARDAERYRWLAGYCRSTSEHWGGRWSIIIDGPEPKTHDSEDDLDAAIDAAMLAAKKEPA